jgi:hypothetical protein
MSLFYKIISVVYCVTTGIGVLTSFNTICYNAGYFECIVNPFTFFISLILNIINIILIIYLLINFKKEKNLLLSIILLILLFGGFYNPLINNIFFNFEVNSVSKYVLKNILNISHFIFSSVILIIKLLLTKKEKDNLIKDYL